MYQDNADTHLMEDTDLLYQCAGFIKVSKDFAARLDNKDLAFEQANIRRRVFERGNDNRAIFLATHILMPEHLVQHGHLREHAIASLGDHDASRAVENVVGHDHASPHRETVHESTVVFSIVEPGLIHTPVQMLFPQFLVIYFVAVVASR